MTFQRLQDLVHPLTKKRDTEIVELSLRARQAVETLERPFESESNDELVSLGWKLRQGVLNQFRDRYRNQATPRVLVHLPSKGVSPAGASLFGNLVESLQYIGINVLALSWEATELPTALDQFRPTVLLTSDSRAYLEKIDWSLIRAYRKTAELRVGLTASLAEYGNTPLDLRLEWARKNNVDFFYSFRTPEYLEGRKEYRPFFLEGYKILSVEFGANPLLYFPVEATRDLKYVFLASSNPDKWPRYFEYLPPILKRYPGFLNGPGWSWSAQSSARGEHRFVYARAQVGLNLHLQESIDWPNELNERTYILAACGTPQLIDSPALLPQRFSSDASFVAKNPKEYLGLFRDILGNPQEASRRARVALEEVFSKHTTFHRAESLVQQISRL